MVDIAKIEEVRRAFQDMLARMQRPEQAEAMRRLMATPEDDIRRMLDTYYDSPAGQADLGKSPELAARVTIVRQVATEALEDEAATDVWLITPIASLGGSTPMSHLHSDEGLQQVLRVLTALEHSLPL